MKSFIWYPFATHFFMLLCIFLANWLEIDLNTSSIDGLARMQK